MVYHEIISISICDVDDGTLFAKRANRSDALVNCARLGIVGQGQKGPSITHEPEAAQSAVIRSPTSQIKKTR